MKLFHCRTSPLVFAALPLLFLFAVTQSPVHALENGLARTPPMGWNSWNVFREKIHDSIFRQIADKLVSSGMAKAGYKYLCIDGGWNVTGNYSKHDPAKFPNGIKPVVDYAHNLGLKVGIYCNWDARNNETRDASAWADWGIDYVKHDSWKQPSTDTAIWITMRDAILATKRPMVYSVHFSDRAKVLGNPRIMNMWRFTNDLVPYYNRVTLPSNLSWGITTVDIIKDMARVAAVTGPGCWADADMIMVELGNQTIEEWKTAFAANCILPSPLILSADIRKSPQPILDIFLNTELIAVNQDTLGSKAWKVRATGQREVWARRLSDSSIAVVFFNMDVAAPMQVGWVELNDMNGKAMVRNLWTHQDTGLFTNGYVMNVPTHGTAFLKITPERFMTHVRNSHSVQSGRLHPRATVRAGNGTVRISLAQLPDASCRVRCAILTLGGKKIGSQEWFTKPGQATVESVNVPVGCRTGMYVVSLMVDNAALNIRKEIRARVLVKE